MENNEMDGKKNKHKPIISIIILILFICGVIYYYNEYKELDTDILILLIIIVIFLIRNIIVLIKNLMNKNVNKQNNFNYDNYLKELPNNFGIGVNSVLIDTKIENNKTIIAIILDLCSRKYLQIIKENNMYVVKILKNIDNNMLENEKYILELLINNNIKNMDYSKWYKLCEQDGIDLGLYSRYNSNIDNKNSRMKRALIGAIPFGVIGFIIFILLNVVYAIWLTLVVYFIIASILFIFDSGNVFSNVINVIKKSLSIKDYNNVMSNNLIRTKYGENEYQKLVSFRNFIKDFGAFANREAKEVVIWDRYLSYAQVFGLTKEIMQTGYNELINNASFQIDNIDNINLDNIEVLI